jgi:hypothetical protein
MAYTNTGPLDCSIPPDLSQLKGRSAIVTGGASGLGEAYVEALVGAGLVYPRLWYFEDGRS